MSPPVALHYRSLVAYTALGFW